MNDILLFNVLGLVITWVTYRIVVKKSRPVQRIIAQDDTFPTGSEFVDNFICFYLGDGKTVGGSRMNSQSEQEKETQN